MNLETLRGELAARNIRIWKEGENIRYRCGTGVFSDELKARVRECKDAILADPDTGTVTRNALSFNQRALYFLGMLDPRSCSYNVNISFVFREAVGAERLMDTCKKLLAAHRALRSVVVDAGEGGAHAKADREPLLPFSTMRIAGSVHDPRIPEVENVYRIPFDLSAQIPVRFTLFTDGNGEELFQIVLHHIACDALSLKVLLGRFFGILGGDILTLPPVDDPGDEYLDFVDDQLAFQEDRASRVSYARDWEEWLARAKRPVEYPFSVNRDFTDSREGEILADFIDPDTDAAITALAARYGATRTAVTLLAFEYALYAVLGYPDFTLGVITSGRAFGKYPGAFGYFANTLPIPSELSPEQTVGENLAKCSRALNFIMQRDNYPFGLLVEDLAERRDPLMNPLFQLAFNYIPRDAGGIMNDLIVPGNGYLDVGTCRVKPYFIAQQTGQFDLTFEAIESVAGTFWNLKYKKNVIPSGTVKEVASLMRTAILAFQANPAGPVAGDFAPEEAPRLPNAPSVMLAATFIVDPILEPCRHWLRRIGSGKGVTCAGYNQLFQELLNPGSLMRKNDAGINALFVRLEDWLAGDTAITQTPDAVKDAGFRLKLGEFIAACRDFRESSASVTFLFFAPCSSRVKSNPSLEASLEGIELEIRGELTPGFKVVTSQELTSNFGLEYANELGDETAHVPYVTAFYGHMALFLTRKIWAAEAKPYKVVVLDCDNTLWDGVASELGPHGVKVSAERKSIQRFLLDLERNGMLLCLCSKNDETTVMEVFRSNADMVLSPGNIVSHRINWQPKSANILSLAEELGFGTETFIFVDDNPVECAEVHSALPQVCVVNLPEALPTKLEYLRNNWVFEHYLGDSGGDPKLQGARTAFYRDETLRKNEYAKAASFSDFLKSLNIETVFQAISPDDVPRVHELSYRVNQFDLSGVKYSEQAILDRRSSDNRWVHVLFAKDRFGDYGMVGACFTARVDETLAVENAFLSCRALGKGIEDIFFRDIAHFAASQGIRAVLFHFRGTGKNKPAEIAMDFLFGRFRETDRDSVRYTVPVEYILGEMPPSWQPGETLRASPASQAPAKPLAVDPEVFTEIAMDLLKGKQSRASIVDEIPPTIEEGIAKVWSDILRRANVIRNQNFFEMGGTSLLVPEIINQVSKRMGIRLELIDVFKYPTIESLARYCETRRAAPESRASLPVKGSATGSLQERFRKARGKA